MDSVGKFRSALKILLLFLLLGAIDIRAQHRPFKFTRFTIEDGLSQSSVGRIMQDSFGFIWTVTEDGLNRYDGSSFKVYRHDPTDSTSIMASWVGNMLEDKHRRMWFMPNSGGLSMYDRGKDCFRNYRVEHPTVAMQIYHDPVRDKIWYLTRNQIYLFDPEKEVFTSFLDTNNSVSVYMTVSGDTAWVITSIGFYRLDLAKNKLTKVTLGHPEIDNGEITSQFRIDIDDAGRVYIGAKGGLYIFEPSSGSCKKYTFFKTLNHGVVTPNQSEVVFTTNEPGKYIWVGTTSNGLFRLNEEDETEIIHYYNSPDVTLRYAISSNKIAEPYCGSDSVLIVPTGNGINIYDQELGRFVFFHNADREPGDARVDSYNFAYSDRSGNLWLSTVLDGVSMIPNRKKFHDVFWLYDRFIEGTEMKLTVYSESLEKLSKSISGNPIRDMLEDNDGDIWICTEDNIVKLVKKSGEVSIFGSGNGDYSFPARNPGDIIQDKDGQIWFIPFDGYPGLLNETKSRFTSYLPDNSLPESSMFCYAGYVDNRKRFWIGETGYLAILDLDARKIERLTKDSTFFEQTARFWYEESDSILWIGTTEKLVKANIVTNKFEDIRLRYNGFASDKSLPLMAMSVDSSGNFWIGSYGGGVVFLDPETGRTKNFRSTDGLSNDYILEVQQDPQGNVWASTNQGISRIDSKTGEIDRYNAADGTVSREFNSGGSLFTRDGIMLFGGTNGLTAFRPGEIAINPAPPQVVLTAFKKFNTEVKLTPGIQVAEEIEIDYKDNLISFEFSALNFINPDSNKYAYMLEGFDDFWIENGSKKEAYFTNLDPGEYTFRVKASNNDEVWNEKGASVRLVINPPFYMTWWFKTIILFTVGAFAYFLYAMRIRNIRAIDAVKIASQARSLEQEKVIKTEISRNLHDEVNTELTLIGNKCLELSGSKLITPELKTELQSLRLLSLQIRGLIDDVIWFIRPENESGEKMISKLTSTIGGMLKFTDYELDIDEDLFEPGYEVDIHIKKQLYLIIKEVLNNIVKHSEATLVGVRLWREGDIFNMTINDNGKGFDMEQKIMGSGLRNIRDRAADISAKLIVESSPGEGVRVSLNVSLRRVESESAKK